MEQITALDFKIKEMAGRIRELREIENLTVYYHGTKEEWDLLEYKITNEAIREDNVIFLEESAE